MCFSCGAERNIKKGDKIFAIGEYYDAAEQYRQGYAKIPAKDRSLRGQWLFAIKKSILLKRQYRPITTQCDIISNSTYRKEPTMLSNF